MEELEVGGWGGSWVWDHEELLGLREGLLLGLRR